MAFSRFQKPDLHMHSVYSDGTDTPEQLLSKVKAAGIDIFSLTDHDTAEGCGVMQGLLHSGDPRFLGGIEFSCKDQLGKYHVLGYCYDVNKPSIREAVDYAHEMRLAKFIGRLAFLRDLGCPVSEEEEAALLRNANPGKPHLVALMLKKGFVRSRDEGHSMLSGYHFHGKPLSPRDAIDAVMRADGLPVLAHGILADGTGDLSAAQMEERVSRLKQYGLMGLECYYSTFTPRQKQIMLNLAEHCNMFVTAGSDYHGLNKPQQLGQTNDPEPERMERFYETVSMLL